MSGRWDGKFTLAIGGTGGLRQAQAQAALHSRGALHFDRSCETLDAVKSYQAYQPIGEHAAAACGVRGTDAVVERTCEFLNAVSKRGGTLDETFKATHVAHLKFGRGQSSHFNRIDWPRIWTMAGDREVRARPGG